MAHFFDWDLKDPDDELERLPPGRVIPSTNRSADDVISTLEGNSNLNKSLAAYEPYSPANGKRQPQRFPLRRLIVESVAALLILGFIAAVLVGLPYVLVSLEWRKEIEQIQTFVDVAYQIEDANAKFVRKMKDVYNQSTPSRELVRKLSHEFVEETYEKLLVKVDGDVRYLDLTPQQPRWTVVNARELVLTTITLTGTSPVSCSTPLCDLLLITATVPSLVLLTIVFAASAGTHLQCIVRLCSRVLCFRPASTEKALLLAKCKREFLVFTVAGVFLGGAVVVVAALVHADQPKWSWEKVALFTYSQFTALGRTDALPDMIGSHKNTAESQFLYAFITFWCIHHVALFLIAGVRLYKAFEALFSARLDDDDWRELFAGDEILRQRLLQANGGLQYVE